ncbi:MAG: NAD(P)H-quinone oxidoreductase subunit I, chloroplastic [Phycisphaerae bacterium]|nr:NAD(P)H-quinone oxidoreductase subunit I, chloroplastic [Phycisphaerae bacterium]
MAKKLPKQLAILDEDLCTGCEACITVCPVDCIDIIAGQRDPNVLKVCTIDLPRCIGCTLCEQVCPWNCIQMVPTEQVQINPAYADKIE